MGPRCGPGPGLEVSRWRGSDNTVRSSALGPRQGVQPEPRVSRPSSPSSGMIICKGDPCVCYVERSIEKQPGRVSRILRSLTKDVPLGFFRGLVCPILACISIYLQGVLDGIDISSDCSIQLYAVSVDLRRISGASWIAYAVSCSVRRAHALSHNLTQRASILPKEVYALASPVSRSTIVLVLVSVRS